MNIFIFFLKQIGAGINSDDRQQWYYPLEDIESTTGKIGGDKTIFTATLITNPLHNFMRKFIKLVATALSVSLNHF